MINFTRIITLLLATNVFSQESDGRWYTWETGGRQYLFSWGRAYWDNARTACVSMGGDLVSINSAEENTFLESLYESGYHWIGLQITCTSTTCSNARWANREDVTFTDWYSNQPQTSSGYNYVHKNFRSSPWYNRHNDNYYNYVCEFTDGCSTNPCSDNYLCISEPAGHHTCTPISHIDECESNPCENGECRDAVGNYSCICESGYEGRNCQTDIDECRTDHGCVIGSCYNFDGGYRCNCPQGYYGKYCQYDVDECENHNCVNGRCVDGNVQYTCACDSGYTGVYCEHDIDECQDPKMCVYGDCKNTHGGYKCTCSGTYLGQKCNLGPDVTTGVAISAAVLAILITVSIVVVVVFVIRRYRKKKTKKTSPPPAVGFDARRNDYIVTVPNQPEQSSAHGSRDEASGGQAIYQNANAQEIYTSLRK